MISAVYNLHVASSSLTPIICHVLVRCFGSLLLQDMFLSLQVFDFERQNMTFIVNVLYCEAVACWAVIRTVCKYSTCW